MDGKLNFLIRGKSELTKKRLQTDMLLRRAMKGDRYAKEKLYKDYGIKLYSSEEVESYVKKKLKTEVVNGLPPRDKANFVTKLKTKRNNKELFKKR